MLGSEHRAYPNAKLVNALHSKAGNMLALKLKNCKVSSEIYTKRADAEGQPVFQIRIIITANEPDQQET